jgi:hypothetical protein
MSIAINTTRARAVRPVARPIVVEPAPRSQAEGLRLNRAMLRHFVFAFAAISAALYAFASGGPVF